MAAPIKPALVTAFTKDSWIWVPAIADKNAPTAIEIEAAAGFNLSCSIFGEQEGVTPTTEKVKLPRRNCEAETFETNGETSYAMADLSVSFDPQGAPLSDGKKAWESMEDMASGFLVRRQGKDSKTVVAAGDYVDVIPGQLAVKVPTKTSNAADGVYAFSVAVAITDAPAWNKVVVA